MNIVSAISAIGAIGAIAGIVIKVWGFFLPTPREWGTSRSKRRKIARTVDVIFVDNGGAAIRFNNQTEYVVTDISIKAHVENRTRKWRLWKPRWIEWSDISWTSIYAGREENHVLDFAVLKQKLESVEIVDWGPERGPEDQNPIRVPKDGYLLFPKPLHIKIDVQFTLDGHTHNRIYDLRPMTDNPRCRFLENIIGRDGVGKIVIQCNCWEMKQRRKWYAIL